jgi:hypothetical protein
MAACGALLAALDGCSLALGWNGYTGGEAGDAGPDADGASAEAAPACGPQTCAGCCESDQCVGGDSASACGLGGGTCQSCASNGLTCEKGACVSSPDAGPAPCSLILCKTLISCLSSIDIACCKPDGTCGCQSIIGATGCQ